MSTDIITITVGANVVSSYDELADARPLGPLEVIFGTVASNRELPRVRRLSPPSNPRTILVIVGDSRRARWSMDLQSGQ